MRNTDLLRRLFLYSLSPPETDQFDKFKLLKYMGLVVLDRGSQQLAIMSDTLRTVSEEFPASLVAC